MGMLTPSFTNGAPEYHRRASSTTGAGSAAPSAPAPSMLSAAPAASAPHTRVSACNTMHWSQQRASARTRAVRSRRRVLHARLRSVFLHQRPLHMLTVSTPRPLLGDAVAAARTSASMARLAVNASAKTTLQLLSLIHSQKTGPNSPK